jgi:integrase
MKTTSGYLFKRNGIWYIGYQLEGRRVAKSTHTSVKADAEIQLARVMETLRAGDDSKRLRIALQDAEDRRASAESMLSNIDTVWREFKRSPNAPSCSAANMKNYEGQWGRFAAWMKEHYPEADRLRAIDRRIVSAYASDLQDSVGPSTFNRHIGLLGLVWKVLADSHGLGASPWRSVRRKKPFVHGRRALTPAELQAVLEAAQEPYRGLILVGAYTGLRLGDAVTLKWDEIQDGRIVRVPSKGKKAGVPVIIPMHPILAAGLPDRKGEYVFHSIAKTYRKERSSVAQAVGRIFRKAGIVTAGGVVDGRKRAFCQAGYHSLRHTFVSLCRTANVPLAVVQAIVGHHSAVMTQYYTHIGEEAAKAAIASLPVLVMPEKDKRLKIKKGGK